MCVLLRHTALVAFHRVTGMPLVVGGSGYSLGGLLGFAVGQEVVTDSLILFGHTLFFLLQHLSEPSENFLSFILCLIVYTPLIRCE